MDTIIVEGKKYIIKGEVECDDIPTYHTECEQHIVDDGAKRFLCDFADAEVLESTNLIFDCDDVPLSRTPVEEYPDDQPERRNKRTHCGQFHSIPLSKEKLDEMYWDEWMSINDIASVSEYAFGVKVSHQHVRREMIRHNIPRRRGSGPEIKRQKAIWQAIEGAL
jgi:hypothetical protein